MSTRTCVKQQKKNQVVVTTGLFKLTTASKVPFDHEITSSSTRWP